MYKGNILVVDDEASTRELLHDYLAEMGNVVSIATDGKDALQKFDARRTDIVIADFFMPHMNGLELLQHIKALNEKVVFIIMTGEPGLEMAVDVMKEGAYDYIVKPFNLDDLRIKTERALHARKLMESVERMRRLMWGVILPIPIWLFLGIWLGRYWWQ